MRPLDETMSINNILFQFHIFTIYFHLLNKQSHRVKTKPYRIGRVVKVFKRNESVFLCCKGVRKPRFGPHQVISYGFNRYLGDMTTASVSLPHQRSVTAIATVAAFLLYKQSACASIRKMKLLELNFLAFKSCTLNCKESEGLQGNDFVSRRQSKE